MKLATVAVLSALWFVLETEAVRAEEPPPLCFEGPKDANKEDLEKCALAMTARMIAYGYKDIAGRVTEGDDRIVRVELKSKTGWSESMCKTAKGFAGCAAAKVELKLRRRVAGSESHEEMTPAEKEQFAPGATPKDDKAPDGSSWFRLLPSGLSSDPDHDAGSVEFCVLLRNDCTLTLAELGTLQTKPAPESGGIRRDDLAGTFYRVNGSGTAKMKRVLGDGGADAYLVIDGKAFDLGWVGHDENFDDKALTVQVARGPDPLARAKEKLALVEPAIRHPMPFGLKLSK